MSDPALALQIAIRAALKDDAALGAIVGLGNAARHYDRVPENPTFPYTRISDVQVIDDGNSCADGSECFVDVHIWSRAVGRGEAKTIGGHVRRILTSELTLADESPPTLRTVVGEFQTARYLDDPNPLTTHGVITFRYVIDPA